MSGCLTVGHPDEAKPTRHTNDEEYTEVLQVDCNEYKVMSGNVRGHGSWDILGIEQGIGLEWSVYRAMLMEDAQIFLWIVLFFSSMWLVHKYTIVPDLSKQKILSEWDLGWG